MPPFALLLCAAAAVLGTLAAAPLSADLRICVDAGLALLALAVGSGRCGSPRFRAILAGAFVTAALNAGLRPDSPPGAFTDRTSRFRAIVLDASVATDGSTALTIALDDGRHAIARVRGAAPPPGSRVRFARPARAVRCEPQSRRAQRTRPRARARPRRAGRRRLDTRRRGGRSVGRCHVARAGARMGARAAARWRRRARRIGRGGRAVGRALRAAARVAGGVSRDRHGARARHRGTAPRRGRRAGTRTPDVARAAALVNVRRGNRADLGVCVVERRPAAGDTRRDDGHRGALRARLRSRDAVVERTGNRGARRGVRPAGERSDGIVRALVLVRRRDLHVRSRTGTVDRSARCAARPRARGARAFGRDADRRLAVGCGGVPAVHALRDSGQLRDRTVRRRDDGARRRAARVVVVRSARAGLREPRVVAARVDARRGSDGERASRRGDTDDAGAGLVRRALRRGTARGAGALGARRADAGRCGAAPRDDLDARAAARDGSSTAHHGARRRSGRRDRGANPARARAARRRRRPARARRARCRFASGTGRRTHRCAVLAAPWYPRARRDRALASARRPRRRRSAGASPLTRGRGCGQRTGLRRARLSRRAGDGARATAYRSCIRERARRGARTTALRCASSGRRSRSSAARMRSTATR